MSQAIFSSPPQFTVLAIDASTDTATLALLHQSQISTASLKGGSAHSEQILDTLQSLLQSANVSLQNLTHLLVGIGPGAFTGLRVAAGVAQGLGLGLSLGLHHPEKIYLQGVSSLCCVAQEHIAQGNSCRVAIDARMNEMYVAEYDGLGNCTLPACLMPATTAQVLSTPDATQLLAWFTWHLGRNTLPPSQAVEDLQPLYVRNQVAKTEAQRLADSVNVPKL